MMTDRMKPRGLWFCLLTSPAPMRHAGGRLFVDVTERLSRPASRRAVVDALGRSDPLIRDALETVVERDDFVPLLPDEAPPAGPPGAGPGAAGTTPEPRSEEHTSELKSLMRTSYAV